MPPGPEHPRSTLAVAEMLWISSALLLGITLFGASLGLRVLPDPANVPALGLLYGPLLTGMSAGFYALAVRWFGTRLPTLVAKQERPAWPHVTGFVVLGIASALIGSALLGQLLEFVGFPVSEQRSILAITRDAKQAGLRPELVLLAISALVAAPLAEETLFRGLLFRRLFHIVGNPGAYVLSAIAFAAIHTNPAGFVIYLWLGVVFAYTYLRTGRLWCAMLVHLGNNAFALTLHFFE